LRQVPNSLLARHFSHFGGFADFDWSHLKESRIEGIFEQWQDLPEAERRQVGGTFRKIHSMATARGTRVLIEAARDRGLDIAQDMGARKNAHERAFACFLDHPDVFENARTLDHIEALPKRSWEKRNGLPKQQIEVTAGCLAELGSRISAYYCEREGRGEICKVEHRRRASGVDSFFAYPADYSREVLGYDADGELAPQPWNGAFEVAFAHDGSAGTVDQYAEGGKQVRGELSEIFAEVVLDQDTRPVQCQTKPYNMELFKNRELPFPTNPADRLIHIAVVGLRVRSQGPAGGTFTISAGVRGSLTSVYDVIQDLFAEDQADLAHDTILEATLRALVDCPGKRHRSITFKISETRCDLGDDAEEQMLRRYLKAWGIERES
jgi:hypothetical protein